jgi:alginate O-acetyltransferase complex protein AlgI
MLFNSPLFLFLFLPIALLGFHLVGKQGNPRNSIAWLVGASLFFYGWWNPAYLGLILFSILFNYGIGMQLYSQQSWSLLIFGIAGNLSLISYYKYANFFIESFNSILGTEVVVHGIILPLAISFFTFQQITYLVDVYRGEATEQSFLRYCLFVTFFPQLIAGPIVHHKEMLPQFLLNSSRYLTKKNLAIGFTIFAIGLFKKVIIADGVATYATPVFVGAADPQITLTMVEAWIGALAFSFQVYFDFSGYSDMAIGLARMFGVRLPLNFNSPYKSTSIIDFWRRWHITLSRFLRDYLYKPLGGNRKGSIRQLYNVMITMLLGGLWHGAAWTFILWGGLHGIFLVINHSWHWIKRKMLGAQNKTSPVGGFISWMFTMIIVVIAWVPFRATSIEGAINMLESMMGVHGLSLPKGIAPKLSVVEPWLLQHGVVFDLMVFSNDLIREGGPLWIGALILMVTLLPNTQQLMRRYRPTFEINKNNIPHFCANWLKWKPTMPWAIFTIILFIFSVLNLTRTSEFLYFQF